MNETVNPGGGSRPGAPSPAPTADVRAGKLARNAAFNLAGYGLPLVIGLASLPFIIHGLGKDRFGVLSLVWIVLGYFGFLDLGLGRATIRFIADSLGRGASQEIPEYLWTSVLVQLGLSLVGTALLAALTPLLVERILVIPAALQAEARTAFYLTAASFPIVMVSSAFRGVLEAAQRFDLVNLVKIPASSANYFVPLASVLFWPSLTGVVALLMAARAISLAAWIGLSLKVFPVLKRRPVFAARCLKPLLSFGGWATVSSLVGSILENLDRFAIGALISVQAVAYYSAPYEAVGRLGILPSSLVTALFPTFSVLEGGGARETIKSLFARSVKVVMAVSGTVAVLVGILSKTLLRLWLGADFAVQSSLVFQLIAASFLFLSFSYVAFSLLQGVGRTDLAARIHLVLLAVYIPLLWIGVKLAGIKGAAAAWLVHLALQAALQYRSARRLGLTDAASLSRTGAFRVPVALAFFAAGGGALTLVLPGAAAAAIAFAAYLPIAWAWVLDAEERAWVRSAAARILKRRGRDAAAEPESGAGDSDVRLLLVGLVPPEAGGGPACGVASHVFELGRQASRRGYDVAILAPLRREAPAEIDGVRLIRASRPRPLRLLAGGLAALTAASRRSFAADLSWRERASARFWAGRIRSAVKASGAQIIHIHPLSHPVGAGLRLLPSGLPVVMTDHGFWQDLGVEVGFPVVREAARSAAAVIAVSSHCLARQEEHGLDVRGERLVIRNPIDLPRAEEPDARAADGRKRVLFVAGVEAIERKGLDLLVAAFAGSAALRAAAELAVIADRRSGRWARKALAGTGAAVLALPPRPRRAMAAAYAAADVFALPSRSEAFPLVFLEALSEGTPVVGFGPAVAELNGILGPDAGRPFDAAQAGPADLAALLLEALSRAPDRAGLSARVRAAFAWDAVFPDYDRLYRRLRTP